jgi:hypothetical protein
MLAEQKKQSQTLNTQSSQLTPTFKTGNTEEGKIVYLNLVFLDMKIIKSN